MNQFNSSLWPIAWALLLSVGWVLPNHYPPWTTFHQDAWVAGVCALAATVAVLLPPPRTPVYGMALVAGVLVLIPGLQFFAGLLTSAGNTWVCTAYLLGFFLALLTGARWESTSAGRLADALFLAIGAAAVLSVGLQMHQWLQLERLDIWSMGGGIGRPYANFGQPNQLATLLLWGVLAAAWAFERRHVGGFTAIFLSAYLLFGVALTASRTAWVGIALLVAGAWLWRRLWSDARLRWAALALAGFLVVCVLATGWLNQVYWGNPSDEFAKIARVSGESRPAIWMLFLDAAMQRPWFGYGWNQVGLAHLAVALDHPPLLVNFSQAHNLFLDLLLWAGLPLGIAVSLWLLWWFFRRLHEIDGAENALLMLLLIVVANHAMLELPLHHAYFLLPVGLVMGMLDVRLGTRPMLTVSRWVTVSVWLAAVVLLSMIVRDYSAVEPAYRTLRFQWASIKSPPVESLDDVVLLTQWRDFIRLTRLEPKAGMSEAELQWMRNVTGLNRSAGSIKALATALALNKHPEEAALWLRRLCQSASVYQCGTVKSAWAVQAASEPRIAAVPWP